MIKFLIALGFISLILILTFIILSIWYKIQDIKINKENEKIKLLTFKENLIPRLNKILKKVKVESNDYNMIYSEFCSRSIEMNNKNIEMLRFIVELLEKGEE